MADTGYACAKRVVDVAVASVALLVLSPVIGLVSLLILIDSRGPVFYRAPRVGRGGRTLHMLKFRKMRCDATGAPLTTASDCRFTRIGCLLARTKLDELPSCGTSSAGT